MPGIDPEETMLYATDLVSEMRILKLFGQAAERFLILFSREMWYRYYYTYPRLDKRYEGSWERSRSVFFRNCKNVL